MDHETELGYLVLELPDPERVTPVLEGVVGLVRGEPSAAGIETWRNDRRANRLFVQTGPANDAVAVGIEAVDAAAFDAVVARLQGIGADLTEGDGSDRRAQRLVKTTAPWGVDVEIVLHLADATSTFSSTLVPGGFLTDGVGFGHAVFVTTAFEASHSFLTLGLGYVQSDWLETELAPGIDLEVRFYHCNRRHHTIALAGAVRPPAASPPHHVRAQRA